MISSCSGWYRLKEAIHPCRVCISTLEIHFAFFVNEFREGTKNDRPDHNKE